MPTLIPLLLSATIAAWAMLSLLGSERERRMRQQKNAPPGAPPAPEPKPAPQATQRATPTGPARSPQKKN